MDVLRALIDGWGATYGAMAGTFGRVSNPPHRLQEDTSHPDACGLTVWHSGAPPLIDRDHARADSDVQKSEDLGDAQRRQLHGLVG